MVVHGSFHRYNVGRQDSNSFFGECSAFANIASKVELDNVAVHSNIAVIGGTAVCLCVRKE